ncbi:MAG: hypothetical protein LBL91_06310 [Lachnospiraceae bacterium]|jgi:hypothetical protein|nr:hypothetical protein [Lachnospiraceae bacterium]
MPKSNESISLKEEIKIHGVSIRKMPNGQYLRALETIKQLPSDFVKEVLEDDKEAKLSDLFDSKNIATVIGTLLTKVPDFTFKFLSKLLDIEEEVLKEKLTPLETIEVVEKFWEVNNLSSFFQKMKPIMSKLQNLVGPIGFKEQSQSV